MELSSIECAPAQAPRAAASGRVLTRGRRALRPARRSVAALDPIDKFEFAIKLRGLNKPYRMRAATEAELLMWVQALKTLLAVRAETARR